MASGDGWEDRVREAAGAGRPHATIDALLDCVGEPALTGALTLVTGTRVRSIADPAGASAAGGSGVTRRRTAEVFERLATMAAGGSVEIVVDQVLPFAESADAVARVESGHARGKTVVTFA